jgi:putative sugar O-methyltransferase
MGAGSLDHHLAVFTGIYPKFRHTKQHELLLSIHGFAYLRMLELYNLIEADKDVNMVIEVGGGSCVNGAVLIGAFGCKYTVIDLPESISVGFSLLKAVFPELKIALPDVIHDHIAAEKDFRLLYEEYDVVFMLPYQTDLIEDGIFNMAFNVSSFQEMNIDVVNEYLSLFHRVLKPGGSLILENLKFSREVKGNSFENYQLNDYAEIKMCEPTYSNFIIKNLPQLEYFFYQGVKS